MSARVSLDSNVLVYSALEPGSEKGARAERTIKLATPTGILAVQALLEFTAVIRRRQPSLASLAIAQADAWMRVFETAPTTSAVASSALSIVRAHQFQVWDAVIWAAARAAGATIFLSEDLQDGFALDGMRVVNPFLRTEAELQSLVQSGTG